MVQEDVDYMGETVIYVYIYNYLDSKVLASLSF